MQQSDTDSSKTSLLSYILTVLLIVPVIPFILKVLEYAVNIPYMDDYDAILTFLCDFKQAGFTHKIALLFSQHNEHRILFSRIVYAVYYALTGTINFRNIILIDNILLLGIYTTMLLFFRKCLPRYWKIAGLVLGLGLFDMNNFENGNFAMAGMANYGIILLFLLSLWFYTKDNKKYLVAAALLQVLCIYSEGNGVIAALFIALYCVLSRNKIKTITSAAVLLIFSPLYFIHYTTQASQHPPIQAGKILPFFLHSVGAHFSNEYGIVAAVVILAGLAILLPVDKKIRFKENTLPFISITGFILATLGAIAVFRSNMPDISSYSSRYFIYSHLLFGILFVFLLLKLRNEKLVAPVSIAVIVLSLFVYKNNYEYGDAGFQRANYFLENADYFYEDRKKGWEMATRACKMDVYCIDDERLNPTLGIPPKNKH
jgi:hypothetical protein